MSFTKPRVEDLIMVILFLSYFYSVITPNIYLYLLFLKNIVFSFYPIKMPLKYHFASPFIIGLSLNFMEKNYVLLLNIPFKW